MLVISRRSDQEVFIGADVRLRVLAIRGNRVQLGIDAPDDVRVHRGERYAEFTWAEQAAPDVAECCAQPH